MQFAGKKFEKILKELPDTTVENEVIVYQKVFDFASVFSVKITLFREDITPLRKGPCLNLSLVTPI